MSLRYYLGSIISIPLLPILYVQGKNIRKNVPQLPQAKIPEGYIETNSSATLKIIAIGESTMAGVGVDFHENGFIGALANEISSLKNSSVSWKVYAQSGFTAKTVLKNIIPKIKETNADIIVIGLGGNDAFKLNSPGSWISQIDQLLKAIKLKFPKTPIYFTNMPPIKEFPAFTNTIKFVIGNLVEILGKRLHNSVKNEPNVYYNSEIVTLKNWQKKHKITGKMNDFFSDGVHPSKLTYQTWGKDMAHFIINSKN